MIRLSCWIGGVGCVLGDQALADHGERSPAPVMPTASVRRCIDADIDSSGGPDRPRFVNAAPRLARHFHQLNAEDAESSLDEIVETWRRIRDKLAARTAHDRPDISGKVLKDVPEKVSCLTDAG